MAHLQGAVPLTDPIYIERPFEEALVRLVTAERWVLLLGPRQHGKTSALIRLKHKLIDAGYLSCLVDLQAQPPCKSYSEFLSWVGFTIAEQIGASIPPSSVVWNDVSQALSACDVGGGKRLVVLIDEASNIPLVEWRNAFFGQIRSISGLRAQGDGGDIFARTTFVFSGTFRPETLIDAENSPFNVCESVETTDLSCEDTAELCKLAGIEKYDDLAKNIYEQCSGQPYLTQRLMDTYIATQSEGALKGEVEKLVSGNASHIRNLFSKIVSDPPLDKIVRTMAEKGQVGLQPADTDYKYAQTIGIAKRDGAKLIFRNRIYREVARGSSQLGAIDPQPGPLFQIASEAFASIQDSQLREFAAAAHAGAISAYKAGAFRLSLVGFGSLLEAYLIDYLERCDIVRRDAAFTTCRVTRYEIKSDPRSWRLHTMIVVSKSVSGARRLELSDTVREWRNFVHPAVTLKDYVPNDQLEPEVRIVSGIFDLIRRELS